MSTESRQKAPIWFAIAALGLAALLVAANVKASFKQEVVFEPADAGETDAVSREKETSAQQISVRELNEFHLALLGRLVFKLPAKLDLSVAYQGIVSDHGKTQIAGTEALSLRLGRGQRVHGDIGAPLEWSIADRRNDPVFSIWVSVRKTRETVAECPLSKRTLFVNVARADKNGKALEKKRDKLGGRSVLDVVGLLKAGPRELEKR